MKKTTNFFAVLFIIFSSPVLSAGYSRLCVYSDFGHTMAQGQSSLGYDGSGRELVSTGSYDKQSGRFFNTLRMTAAKATRLSVKVKSRYFQPEILIVTKRGKRVNSRILGKSSSGWVAEATYDADREYPDELVNVYVTTTEKHHSRQLRGSEFFLVAKLHKEECTTEGSRDNPKPSYQSPPSYQLPPLDDCPPGKRKLFGSDVCM